MATWADIQKRIFATESGGDYNALYGYQNRPGGLFDEVRITDMTVDDALDFTNPKGRYGAFVSTQTPDNRIATPIGAYQVVGSTLRDAKRGLGLKGNERMTPELQDRIGKWIYETQGAGAWEGLKGKGAMEPTGILGAMAGQREEDTPFYKTDRFGNVMDSLIVGLNSMRLNPDENIARMAQGRMARRQQKAQTNRTLEWMRANGYGQYADMIAAGQLDPKAVLGAIMTKQMEGGKPQYQTLTGAQINSAFGTNLPEDKLFNRSPQGQITQVGGGGTSINVGAQESEWQKGIAKAGVEQLTAIRSEATNAENMLNQARQLRNLMQDPNFQSGAFAESKMGMKKIVEALGGDPANVESMEGFRAVTSQLILDKMGGSLGAGFSEGDRKFIEQMQPQLSTSVEGNKLIIQLNEAVARRKLQVNDFANQYIQENGMLDQNFDAALRKWAKENPLFDQSKYF